MSMRAYIHSDHTITMLRPGFTAPEVFSATQPYDHMVCSCANGSMSFNECICFSLNAIGVYACGMCDAHVCTFVLCDMMDGIWLT